MKDVYANTDCTKNILGKQYDNLKSKEKESGYLGAFMGTQQE